MSGKYLAKRVVLPEAPLVLTQKARDVSVTERNDFKGCRRRWYLGTVENLEPRYERTWYYDFGTGLHAGLEGYYRAIGGIYDFTGNGHTIPIHPLLAATIEFDKWYEKTDTEIVQSDAPSEVKALQRDELLGFKELGTGMLTNYDKFARVEDDFVVCAVEGEWTERGLELLQDNVDPPFSKNLHPVIHESGRFLTPIVNPTTGKWVTGRPYLSARLDLIVYSFKTGYRGFWVVDHKSAGSQPSDRGLEMDDQVTGYDYTFYRHTGIVPRGTWFNFLIKQVPKEPRIVRDGAALSYAKDQLTTAEQYREAMIEFGHMTPDGTITSPTHEECYKSLLAHGWTRFYRRFEVSRNLHELKMFELRLPEELADMRAVVKDPARRAYPHLSQYNCPGCSVMRICKAIEDGSDYDSIIEGDYQQAPDRKAK